MDSFAPMLPSQTSAAPRTPAAPRGWRRRPSLLAACGALGLLCALLAVASSAFLAPQQPRGLRGGVRGQAVERSAHRPGGARTQYTSVPFTGATAGESSRDSTPVVGYAASWLPSLPQGCEDDFECNDGKANFPLQCCELPLLGNFCCEPDDFRPAPSNPATVLLPVPVEDPWEQQQQQRR
mmetsp:Transcript_3729/g.7433  ORF Transcript_3729/g.7433 Transcript_3729/m.7433 type:complete len:181 (-) Transcript_3729:374-916(-)